MTAAREMDDAFNFTNKAAFPLSGPDTTETIKPVGQCGGA